jgi:hypothetical protein
MQLGPNGFRMKAYHDAAVVCFANARYAPYIPRFRAAFRKHSPKVELFIFQDESEIGAPRHSDNPYAFKVYAIDKVRNAGYRIVLWCDSVLQLTRPIEQLLPEIVQNGVYLAQDGWKTGMFANDRALQYFGVTRDQAMEISAIWACFMGFDFANPITHEFFAKWKKACNDGIFRGGWNNEHKTESQDERCKGHRHDQTCAELVAHQMNLPLSRHVVAPQPEYDHRFFTGREW